MPLPPGTPRATLWPEKAAVDSRAGSQSEQRPGSESQCPAGDGSTQAHSSCPTRRPWQRRCKAWLKSSPPSSNATVARRRGIGLACFQPPLRTSAGVIAGGCFVSPARLVNDCEYTADRALSKGSSDGAMPAGSTKGSKLRSVAALVSSLSTRSSVKVPTSTWWRSDGQGKVASLGSPG